MGLAAVSLINQVLNELESRGANVSLGEDAIRAVPPRKRAHPLRYAILAISMLSLLAAAGWYVGRAEKPAQERRAVAAAPLRDVVQTPVVAVSAPLDTAVAEVSPAVELSASQPSADLHGKPLLAVAGEEKSAVPPEIKKAERSRKRRNKQQEAQGAASGQAEAAAGPPLKQITPQQRVENEFGRANQAAQEGRLNDALAGYEGVLRLDPKHHASRRALVGVLVSLKRNGEAEGVLQNGLKLDPHEASFAMLLARLQVERDAVPLALDTLQATLPYAEGRADYQAFVAALLQRQNRHDEAVAHFQTALKLAPNNGIWLMGMGISLQALHRGEDARAAYQRALASNSLNAQLQAFVQQKLKEL